MDYLSIIDRQSFLIAWTWALIHTLWIGLVLAFIYYTILQRFAYLSSRYKYWIGLSMVLCLPVTAFSIFVYHLPSYQDGVASITYVTNLTTPLSYGVTSSTKSPDVFYYINQYADALFAFWITGMIMMSIRLVYSYLQIQKMKSSGIVLHEQSSVVHVFNQLAHKAGITKKIVLLESEVLDMPSTIGHIKPIILLPIGILNQLSLEETHAILAHEIAHILRKDYIHNLIISFVEVLFFFHPSVWWFSSTLRSLREQCCDDIAISLGAEKMALSKALIRLEERTEAPQLAMAFTHKNQLFNRIQRLFNPTMKNEFTISRDQAPLLIGALALLLAFSKPVVTDYLKESNISISKPFWWEKALLADTTKPTSRIEKITKDNGKEKLELKLKDNKIEELKVNDKVISPSDYDKYAVETETLKKELSEIESPDRMKRKKIYRDFEPPLSEEKFLEVPDVLDELEEHAVPVPRAKSRPRIYAAPEAMPYIHGGNKDGFSFGFGHNNGGNKSFSFSMPESGDIKWIIDGDSNNIEITGNKVIIRDDEGDVIVDLTKPGAWAYSHPGRILAPDIHLKGLHTLPDNLYKLKEDIRWKLENDLNLKKLEHLKFDDEFREELKEELMQQKGRMHELLEDQKELSEKIRRELKSSAEKWRKDHQPLDKDFQFDFKHDLDGTFPDMRKLHDSWPGKSNLQEIIAGHLIKDGLIKKGSKYEFKLDPSGLRIDGKKQSEATYVRYQKLLQEYTGIDAKEGTMSFSFSSTAESKD